MSPSGDIGGSQVVPTKLAAGEAGGNGSSVLAQNPLPLAKYGRERPPSHQLGARRVQQLASHRGRAGGRYKRNFILLQGKQLLACPVAYERRRDSAPLASPKALHARQACKGIES